MDKDQPVSAEQRAQYDAEHERIDTRRKLLGLEPISEKKRHWAVALSGGGIRSATFCLGVLQAMSRARAPGAPAPSADETPDVRERLLPEFDYLSTVSGGGYLGSFFGSLFLPGRLRERPHAQVATSVEAETARQAYEVLDYEPPGRIRTSIDYSHTPPGEAPLAWLRENGRYLTPTGSGDLFYVLALSLRNLLAVHFVIGLPLLGALALAVLLQVFLSNSALCSPAAAFLPLDAAQVLCGALWWVPGAVILIGVIPLILAFWMVYAFKSQDEPVHLINRATALYAVAALTFAALAIFSSYTGTGLRTALGVAAGVCVLGLFYCFWTGFYLYYKRDRDEGMARHDSVRTYRVLITRRLASVLIATLVLSFFALVPWLSQWIYLRMEQGSLISGGALLSALIMIVRTLSMFTDDKATPGWLSRVPVSAIAGVVGIAIFMLVSLFWGVFVQHVRFGGIYTGDAHAEARLLVLAGLALALSLAAGRFIGFINLSSLQAFYSSRLARAYLGASNGVRFSGATRKIRKQRLSVAETLPGDDVPIEHYYGTPTCAPVHLINVTLNLTVDPAEQLVQRDRKGKPLCLAPSGFSNAASVSYILDGEPRKRANHQQDSEIYQPLGLAHWVATSGAAFSTGLGRSTSLGLSLAFGLTNLRLGTWWPSSFIEEDGKPYTFQDNRITRAFTTQTYLFYELSAHFHGIRRDYQYLSDGGHFENTATYELIREGRNVELIVMCDCGADPKYQFDDLSNLIRLARIDQGLEIVEDEGIRKVPELARYFGGIQNFAKPTRETDRQRCALLFNVLNRQGERTARLLVLKPNLIDGLSVDVLNYASEHATFPNESTVNQFFDEAQFESYRQLGLYIGKTLFGDGRNASAAATALWNYL